MSSDETTVTEPTVTDTGPTPWVPQRWDAARMVFAACLVVMLGSLCWGDSTLFEGDDTADNATESGETGQQDEFRESSEANDGGELTIVESGYTGLTDLAGDRMVSWGLIVENTSKTEVATSVVSYQAIDANGDEVSAEVAWDNKVEIFALKPGERTGVGATSYLGVEFEKLTFHFSNTIWTPDAKAIGTVEAEKVSVKRVGKGDDENYWGSDGISHPVNAKGRLRITIRVESGYRVLVGGAATAIYRDTDGEIVGASDPDDFERYGDFPPGWCERTIEVGPGPPAAAVDEKVEVYAQGAVSDGVWSL